MSPLFGLIFAHFLRGDSISPELILGAIGVAVGIYLVSTG
jgi:drug/metabolite transporter (DMT)-like permease